MFQLFDWQVNCLDAWKNNEYRGIVNVVTGAGKTVLALAAIDYLQNHLISCQDVACSDKIVKLKVKIIVPQTFLVSQWKEELQSKLNINPSEIGVFCGLHKDTADKRFMIYVVNSARNSLSSHILNDVSSDNAVLLIADECHRYTSGENSKIFDFYSLLDKTQNKYFSLGLSATPKTARYEVITRVLGSEFFSYGFADALHTKIISNFLIFSIGVRFSDSELLEYLDLSEQISILHIRLTAACPELKRLTSDLFFARLESLASSAAEPRISDMAATLMTLSYRRKAIVYLAEERINCALRLVSYLETHTKIIVFCERIETSEILYSRLRELYPNLVGLYHSGMDVKVKKRALEQYKSSVLRILITCKALDEGLNVPDTDVGIIVSSSSTLRQRVQRLGRILRKSKKIKKLYYLFVENSNEDTALLSDMNDSMTGIVPMLYGRFNDGAFHNEHYEVLMRQVILHMEKSALNSKIISTLQQNLELGLIRCDWWMAENDCRSCIELARSKEERNYYIAMLYVILARLDKL